MADYISREAALDFHIPTCDLNISAQDERAIGDRLEKFLESIPAADVRPVMRGKWANEHLASTSGGTYAVIRCSVCKSQFPLYKTNYCPNCGADMREVKADG